MSLSKSESDIILNRANIALSRSQRLVASWLPAQPDDEQSKVKTEEELQKEEDEIFTAVPETLGVGAPLPEKAADGSWNRKELSSNDILRKQLLGRNYEKVMKANAAQAQVQRDKIAAAASASASAGGEAGALNGEGGDVDVDDYDEEDGRAAMVGKKRKIGSGSGPAGGGAAGDGQVDQVKSGGSGAKGRGKKKATSYLDEILAQRAGKKKRR